MISTMVAGRLAAQIPLYGSYYLHDPGTMIRDGNTYFIYGDGQGISGIKSTDLRNWSSTSAVFPGAPPAWTTSAVPGFSGYFWAPDIAYFNGRYNLYYACSQWGTINSAIGLVTSPSLVSPVWTDQGKVVQSNPNFATNATTDLTAYNCIDPSILVDVNGSVWMSFGSYSDGILVMQLDPTTGKRISPSPTYTKIADSSTVFFNNGTEGSCLYQRGGYYYLFLNYGSCCSGVDSTYNIRVGRSTSITGPYVDRNGVSMLSGGGTVVLESTARFIGPGHAAIMNDNGTNWFTYHYYDGNNGGTATVGLNRIYWTADNWPALTNDWSAFYTFNVSGQEHLGLYNATLQPGGTIVKVPARGNVLNINGTTNGALFPLTMANASTFTTWVKWNGGADWQRIFDFGNDTTNYFFLTPRANNGRLRFAITDGGAGAEKIIEGPTALPTNSWCHVAVVLDGAQGILYLNGEPVGTNSLLTLRPWQLLARRNYLGQSQYAADPFFSGDLDSLRIFGRALSGAEIRDLAWAHPALAHRYSFNSNGSNVWDSIGMAHGTLIGNAVITNGALVLNGATGGYVNLPGGLVSSSLATTVEFWATFGVNGTGAQVFDFGNISGGIGQNYLSFSPHSSSGGQRLEVQTSGTKIFDVAGTLDNRTLHVVCIIDPSSGYMAIYTNAVLEQTLMSSMPALSGVSPAWSFIGRSLTGTDAYLNASIDEFRIYDGRLTPAEIAADFQSGPNALALPVTLTPSNAPARLTLSWPSWAVGFQAETVPTLGGGVNWSAITSAPALINDNWQLTVPPTNTAQFFHLRR
jgi:arabinan endo-1,5-alpha-L-arabinosidase